MSEHGHVVPVKTYVIVWIALMVLLALTVAASFWNTGAEWINVAIMLTIAIAKMMLILLYFMHVRWSSKLVQVFAASGFLWVLFLFAIAASDWITRPELTRLSEQVQHSQSEAPHDAIHKDVHGDSGEEHGGDGAY